LLKLDLRHVDVLEFVRADPGLWEAPLLATLSPAQREWLLGQARALVVRPEQPILPARPARELHLVLEGGVVLSAGEGEVGLSTLGKGDCFGLSAALPEACPLLAAADHAGARLALLPGEAARELCQRVEGFRRWLETIAEQRRALARECCDFLERW
jgi:signal-transduction protein with cAMP-binding, CBS, and nucleotidyltransferase domain